MKKLSILLVFLLFAGLQAAFSQRSVTGVVTKSTDNSPLAGVTVVVKGTTTGTITDAEGKFTLAVPNNQAVLAFSFIGFASKEVTVGSQATVNVTLEETTLEMTEVVVTALGIKRESKSLGYATATVNTDAVTSDNNTNMGNALMGKVAGLNVSAPSTGPGGSSKLRIRGQSSFGANNSPLIVINGVPINNSSSTTGIGGDFGDGLQSINPEDVESITVLKGATAAALYGFRAKDGVIIMTTKTGTGSQGLGIEVTQGFIFDKAIDFTDFQYVYGQGENGIRPASIADARSSSSWSFGEKMDGADIYAFDGQLHPYSPVKNRFSLYDMGFTSNTTVAFSGGNEKGGFHFSVGNLYADAMTPNSNFNKKTFDYGVNYKFGKITLQSNANYSIEHNQNPPGSTQGFGISNSVYTTAVSVDLKWLLDVPNDGGWKDPVTGNELQISRFADRTNPYWTAFKRFEFRDRNRLFGNVLLKIDLFPWLYVQGRIGQDWYVTDSESNTPTGTAYVGAAPTGQFNGGYSISKSNSRELNSDFLIGLNKKFGDFGFDAQLGGNAMYQKSTSLSTSVTNFYIRDLYTIENGVTKSPSQGFSEKKVNSLYGTVNLSYKDFLYLNGTARNDWFSTLNPESNSYLYPSVSTSFLFSQAFKSVMPAWLSYGKLRASYAEVGGDTGPYQGTLYYGLNTNAFNGTYAQGNISNGSAPNPDLRPLKVKETEFGLEMILFNRRLTLDVAAYRKNTVDEILSVGISNASGYGSTQVNVGKLRNDGIEALVTVVPVRTQNLTWESTFNYSYNISEVLELAEGQTILNVSAGQMWLGAVAHEVGKPLGSMRGYDYVRNENGQIITSNGYFTRQANMMTYGSIIPPHVGGWINTVSYKKFRIMAQIDFKAGHKLTSQSAYNWLREGFSQESLVGREGGVIMDGVYDADPTSGVDWQPNATAVPVQTFYGSYSSQRVYTPFIYDASFIKWRTITASYDFSSLVKGTFIKGLSLNASINNVLVLLTHVPNLDPECVSNVSDSNGGIEQMGPPTTRSFGITLKARF
jgi:TonB-linked SusC/RagA family outer membrane protein